MNLVSPYMCDTWRFSLDTTHFAILFFVYINYKKLNNRIKLSFADDMKIVHIVNSQFDAHLLQFDLDSLYE